MKKGIILLLFLTQGCAKVIENSNSSDRSLYGVQIISGTPQFVEAKNIIVQHCNYCHADWNSYAEADFVSAGLVVSQNMASSPIYYRNQNATSGPGPQNMPQGGYPALTVEELTLIESWINSF